MTSPSSSSLSLDGTFRCDLALRRLLARCPSLSSHHGIVSLAADFDESETIRDRIASALAEPLLHPKYTIPIIGCFRPLGRVILDKAVDRMQSQWTRLASNWDSGGGAEEVGDGDLEIIGFYVTRKRGIRVHELACLAFCRVLDLQPFLSTTVLNYFRFAHPPFERLRKAVSALQQGEADSHLLLEAARTSLRLLIWKPEIISKIWNWCCFLDIVEFLGNTHRLLMRNMIDLRWCAIIIVSITLRMSDRATENFGVSAVDAFLCKLRWDEFCQDIALEKASFYFQTVETGAEIFGNGILGSNLSLISIGGPFMCPSQRNQNFTFIGCQSKKRASQNGCSASPFVLTSAVKKGVEMVLVAIGQNCPVLLHGSPGSGKTALIKKLAEVHQTQVIFIHMDDQMDCKVLVGSYICSEQPGEFRWQPGTLTQAVFNGFWVVFEGIDKAPAEVHSILLPLLEGARSFATVHGEGGGVLPAPAPSHSSGIIINGTRGKQSSKFMHSILLPFFKATFSFVTVHRQDVNVAESFRLFATVSGSRTTSQQNEGFCTRLWRKVVLGSSGKEDLVRIILAWYPCLEAISFKLTETLDSVNGLQSIHKQMPQPGVSGKFSTRHLLKFCKRIIDFGINFSGPQFSHSECLKIYQEAIDIFASSLPTVGERLLLMKELATIWGIPHHEIESSCLSYKPCIQDLKFDLQVGRTMLQRSKSVSYQPNRPFANLRSSLQILEKIACSVRYNEPVLLVGETGTGKTTLVQNLAMRLGQPLVVLNLSQQSDASDLLGGFKPSDARSTCIPLYHEFLELFCGTFSAQGNDELLRRCKSYRDKEDWKKLLGAFGKCVKSTSDIFSKCKANNSGSKRKRPEELLKAWERFSSKVESAHKQIRTSHMTFSFVEGAFVTAIKKGHWILLDEVNLAPQETLQRVIGVLDGDHRALCLVEKGDIDYVDCHPSFRIFCCMNPANDAGKRDLPHSFRSRFTEYFVDDVLDDADLRVFISQYFDEVVTSRGILDRIVQFYITAKKSEDRLQDGGNQKPQFSLRSLARALEYTKTSERKFGLQKSFYDGFSMFFVTSLDGPSGKIMKEMIVSSLLSGSMPTDLPFEAYLENPYSICSAVSSYVLTPSVKDHLKNLARAVYAKKYPVLLQGPTSSGKTSLVQYLASITGNGFVRINNHEHTDLQEYFGSYITNSLGKLEFQEGVLVKAVRKGYWVVLDELNLAPSDVLEALNRLLDDNRELFVPELQEIVPAHPNFMLFATQNPPTLYAGRKMLSRAFRNRFLEIHVDEIPENELSEILEKRCKIPLSYAKKMVEVMKDLQLHRQNSKVFSGKHGFITPRDLFRWANRFQMFGMSYLDLARDGYFLLAERSRELCEKDVVQDALERHLRVKLLKQDLYTKEEPGMSDSINEIQKHAGLQRTGKVTMTQSMWRLYFLVERCYKLREPVLLVGETGGGKTTVCQLLSDVIKSNLHILNCHQYSEASDFIGGFHPVRDRSRLATEFKSQMEKAKKLKFFHHYCGQPDISSDIGQSSSTISALKRSLEQFRDLAPHSDVSLQDISDYKSAIDSLIQIELNWQAIFVWQDGPLVQAMKNGDIFLVDEISLADDSVLERLNSVLEPERTLSLAEKGGSSLEKITAHPDFFLLATMNPGGDYGKKELSPALRNRFTEIWVSSVTEIDELRYIACERFVKSELTCFSEPMINFFEWFNRLETGRILTVRDLISWVTFMNETEENLGSVHAFLHGAFLVVLDGLGLGTNILKCDLHNLRERSLAHLLEKLKVAGIDPVDSQFSDMESYGWKNSDDCVSKADYDCIQSDLLFGIRPFYISKGQRECKKKGFEFLAPTTCRNSLRLLRAMQLRRPVLLEGSPGVGKTSLVIALAEFSGHDVVRINLSEQTDMMDLLGSDLPVPCDNGMQFAWSDGILLQALKNGSWVLLDELNLAPQSVLEGLNAILDHRAEVYIPELASSFRCPSTFRVFACQNPTSQGGGRKGLPKSFLNRFTKVYVDELSAEDYYFICHSLHPLVPSSLLSKLIDFNSHLYEDTMLRHKYGQEGSPWEFNLRDVIRACQIIEDAPVPIKEICFLNTIYIQRMRTPADRSEVAKLYAKIFEKNPLINQLPKVEVNADYLVVGNVSFPRNHFQPTKTSTVDLNILPGIRQCLEAALQCVKHQWLCVLVGPSSCGKTSVVQLLSQLTGNTLHELNLSSGTDVSELLGCFEQYNALQNLTAVISQIERFMGEYCGLRVSSSWEKLLTERKELIAKWWDLLPAMNDYTSASGSPFLVAWNQGDFKFLDVLIEIIEQLKLDLVTYSLPVSWSHEVLTSSLNTVFDLKKKIKELVPANFEWVNGRLISAIESGQWVVLDNANLCNPTVLDRINSLVESDGFITVNERGLLNGSPFILRAHPNFRMFITFDPTYGEISRAMRNRGVELFMSEENLLDDTEDSTFSDVRQFLIQSGIPLYSLVEAMSQVHYYSKIVGLRLGVRITLLELKRWVQLFQQLIISGNQSMWSLILSWEHTYLTSLGEAEADDVMMHVKNTLLSHSKDSTLMGSSLCLPLGWPLPQKISDLVCFSKEATVMKNCAYLEFLGAQFASQEMNLKNMKSGACEIPMNAIYQSLFPCDNFDLFQNQCEDNLVNCKMLSICSNWVIEQATGNDLQLYFQWFQWYGDRLRPHCDFFQSFYLILKQEIAHPIWISILSDWEKSALTNQQYLPLLSTRVVDLYGLMEDPSNNISGNHLRQAIQCVGILRLSLEQWNAEISPVSKSNDFLRTFSPILQSLKLLEKEVLSVIIESSSFDDLYDSYAGLLEHHQLFWKCIFDAHHLQLSSISWHLLKKEVLKLERFFPKAVNDLLVLSSDLLKKSAWSSAKTFIWKYCGHPSASPSKEIFEKEQQILSLCADIWLQKKFLAQHLNDHLQIEACLFANTELRYLAAQGICMSRNLITAWCESPDTVYHLDEIYLGLQRRIERERSNLTAFFVQNKDVSSSHVIKTLSTTCCMFSSDLFRGESAVDCWIQTLPLFDKCSLLLDFKVLQELSDWYTLDCSNLIEVLSKISNFVRHALDYSLKLSSRPPANFSPHHKILWLLDAWDSVKDVRSKFVNVVHEIWFNWHSSLWFNSESHEKSPSQILDETCLLLQPVRFDALERIIRGAHPICKYSAYCFKTRVTLRNLYQDVLPVSYVVKSLHATARSLFHQIIFAHEKSFDAMTFNKIKTVLHRLKTSSGQNLKDLKNLILSSNCSALLGTVKSLIEPLIAELYSDDRQEHLSNIALAWVHLGLLRFYLLLNLDRPDPAVKHCFKHSVMVEKISMLELDIQIRQQCENLVGRCILSNEHQDRLCLLKKLKDEKKNLQTKVVYRPNVKEFETLKNYCAGFLGPDIKLPCDMNNMDEVRHWHVKSSQFIHQLSSKYSAYIDVVQPVEVAIYEIKLGVSLFTSSALENECLMKLNQNRENVLAAICSLMRFPRPSNDSIALSDAFCQLLKKLSDNCPSPMLTVHQLETGVHHLNLMDVAYHVWTSLIMDVHSFSLLNKVFEHFASLWFGMKFQVQRVKDLEDMSFKFKPRPIKIDDVLNIGMLSLNDLDSNVILDAELEDTELAQGNSQREKENLDEEWNRIPESLLKSILNVHSQLFGSGLLKESALVTSTVFAKLKLFLDSFDLGACLLQGLPTLMLTTLDEDLAIEQILRVSLECEENMRSFKLQTPAFNIYKDPNASAISEMVEPLLKIQHRVKFLLNEWFDHPALQKLFDATEMLLNLPSDTVHYKALCGLESLIIRIHSLQESFPKLSVSDLVEPVYSLVYKWQMIELDCWPKLLDGIEEQYEINASKLWFPLYSVLHHEISSSTVQSIEEFLQTSTIGEFGKRLELLCAFHGQFKTAICLNISERPHKKEILNILYNSFGYYVQFSPPVTRHIATDKKARADEIRNQIKLLKWEQPDSHLSIERFKLARSKLWKTIRKFNEFLQQPVMVFLSEQTNMKNSPVAVWFKQKPSGEGDEEPPPFPKELTYSGATERLLNYCEWREKVKSAIESAPDEKSNCVQDKKNSMKLSSFSGCQKLLSSSSGSWVSLEKIYGHSVDFSEVWKKASKNMKKRRSLVDLLKTLESSGLSRRRSFLSETDNSDQSSNFFLQSSYDVQHLILEESEPSISHNINGESLDSEWKKSNERYFKNISLLQEIQQVRLNFHKDLSLEQVNRILSFIEHLITIQQDQRSILYNLSEQIKRSRSHCSSLETIGNGGGLLLSHNHWDLSHCMWKQKKLFDKLISLTRDISMVVQCIGNSHLNGCSDVKDEVAMLSIFLDKTTKSLHKSKESLDKYLLRRSQGVSTSVAHDAPFIVSKEMELVVVENFRLIHCLEEDVKRLNLLKSFERSAAGILLCQIQEFVTEGKLIEQELLREVDESQDSSIVPELDAVFTECCANSIGMIKGLIEKLSNLNLSENSHLNQELIAKKVTSWNIIFKKFVLELQFDLVFESSGKTLISAGELLHIAGNKDAGICARVEVQLKHLHELLDLFLNFGDALLKDFLAVHNAICVVSQTIEQIFLFLLLEGFGGKSDEAEDESSGPCQDAAGTGMGEGEGTNDVSNQIEDEEQLLGASAEKDDGMEKAADNAPSKTDKGIEMEEDFAADMFSVSEDSEDDENGENEDEDVKIDSAMGQGDQNSQVVDEKLWEKEDGDEKDEEDEATEKYDTGPAVGENDQSSRELRGKDSASGEEDESRDHTDCENSGNRDESRESDDGDEPDETEMDGSDAFKEQTGIELEEKNNEQREEDYMDEAADLEGHEDSMDEDNREGGEEHVEDHRDSEVDGGMDQDDNENGKDAEKTEPTNEPLSSERDHAEDSAINSFAADPSMANDSADVLEARSYAPLRGMPSEDAPRKDMYMPDSTQGEKLSHEEESDRKGVEEEGKPLPSLQRIAPNPYRSLGDAMEEWKERVKLSDDQQENQQPPDQEGDCAGEEYQFLPETEKNPGSSQTLAPATYDQINENIDKNDFMTENHEDEEEKEQDGIEADPMEVVKEDDLRHNLMTKRLEASALKQEGEGPGKKVPDQPVKDGSSPNSSFQREKLKEELGDLVSFENHSSVTTAEQFKEPEEDISGANRADLWKMEVEEGMILDPLVQWRRYERKTMRLSQELCEQLRLVMEPTLASKLQGDYKTGKRINMKKVIAYIASQYRKDKIWLRRTKPNRREYQVVIAVDDSRSMSESGCSEFAVEALAMICRAMTQLEVGQFAVASFGEKGNTRVLHDFDQPFTLETGAKIMSNLSFKQDNTVRDEPVVDLLKYLDDMLDSAVSRARLPSGVNPLHQLILIIADGRFQDKEKLRRRVRDLLQRGRMVAFVLLDNPEESIMDIPEYSFAGGKFSCSKYMDTFPFPYYVVLRHIEALPRTVSDLLRQWFQLMLSSGE